MKKIIKILLIYIVFVLIFNSVCVAYLIDCCEKMDGIEDSQSVEHHVNYFKENFQNTTLSIFGNEDLNPAEIVDIAFENYKTFEQHLINICLRYEVYILHSSVSIDGNITLNCKNYIDPILLAEKSWMLSKLRLDFDYKKLTLYEKRLFFLAEKLHLLQQLISEVSVKLNILNHKVNIFIQNPLQ